jgi:hypothetical protein
MRGFATRPIPTFPIEVVLVLAHGIPFFAKFIPYLAYPVPDFVLGVTIDSIDSIVNRVLLNIYVSSAASGLSRRGRT